MSTEHLQPAQTEAHDSTSTEVLETSAPGQPVAGVEGCAAAVTPLSRIEDHDSPPQELGAKPLDVADSVRQARRRLKARTELNAMDIGDRSVQLEAQLEPVREAIYRATLADLGLSVDGPDRPTEALRMTARNLASLDVLAETFWTWIETRGVLTAKGKTRSAVTTLLGIIDRQTKLAAVVGLERKARDVSRMSMDEFLAAQPPQPPPQE